VPGLYLRSAAGDLIPLEPRVLGETADLQPLLARAPQLLVGDAEEGGKRYVLVQRELGIAHGADGGARWSVDHLFLDDEGVPTLVEVKQSSNTQIRREVVGQLLEYGANFSNYWTADRIRDSYEAQCRERDVDPAASLADALGATDTDAFWAAVDEKISARRLRLVFAADAIPSELRQIIEFLNEELQNTEVLGVEIREHAAESGSLVTARTIGSTEAAQVTKSRGGKRKWRKWTEPDYLESVQERLGPDEFAAVAKIVAWAKHHDPPLVITFGTGISAVGMQIGFKRDDAYVFPFTIFNTGGVEVNFQQMASVPYPPFHRLEMRKEIQRRLNEDIDAAVPDDRLNLRPNFPIALITAEEQLGRFLAVFDWCLDQGAASGIGLRNLDAARAETGE
jgi:hypothetical protein